MALDAIPSKLHYFEKPGNFEIPRPFKMDLTGWFKIANKIHSFSDPTDHLTLTRPEKYNERHPVPPV